jgi:hypothetical protein
MTGIEPATRSDDNPNCRLSAHGGKQDCWSGVSYEITLSIRLARQSRVKSELQQLLPLGQESLWLSSCRACNAIECGNLSSP